MLTLLVDATYLGSVGTGMERYLAELLHALQDHGIRVVVARARSVVSFQQSVNEEIVGPKARIVAQQLWFPGVVRRVNPQVLLLASVGAPVCLGRPATYLVHDVSPWRHPEWSSAGVTFYGKPLTTLCLSRHVTRHIVTVSNFSASEIISVLNPRVPVTVLGGGPGHRALPDISPREVTRVPYFLAVGTLEPRKNMAALIEGWELFRRRVEWGGRLVVVGRRGWRQDLVPSQGIEYLGYVDDTVLERLFRQATAFVSTSLYEGLGLPVLEAARYRCLVVGSDIPPYREALGEAYVRVRPEDPRSIACGLHRVAEMSRSEALSIVERAADQADRMSWDLAAERLATILYSTASAL